MCRLGLPLLVLCNHIDLVLGIPVKRLEHDVVTDRREPDLGLPVGGLLLQRQVGWGEMGEAGA